jgi:hypothetical protein
MTRPLLYIAGRMVFAGFSLVTSLFCLLAFIPFTYQQVVKARLIPALSQFAELHPAFNGGMLALVLLLLCFDRPATAKLPRLGRILRLFFLILLAAQTVFLLFKPVLSRLENSNASYVYSLLAFLPMVGIAVLDWVELFPAVSWSRGRHDEDRSIFGAACWTACFVTVLYGVIAYIPRGGSGLVTNVPAGIFALGVSGLIHALALLAFFVVLNLLMVVAGWFRKPPLAQFLLFHLLGATVLWLVFRGVVFPGMSFQGWHADCYAAAFSLSLAGYVAGLCLRLHKRSQEEVRSGFAFSFWVAPKAAGNHRYRRTLLALALLAVCGYGIAAATARNDWNYLLQKVAAIAIWVVALRIFYVAARRSPAVKNRSGTLLLCSTGILFAYRGFQTTQTQLWTLAHSKQTCAQFLQTYAGYNASFKLIYDAILPEPSDGNFYRFLTKNTNIPRSIPINPAAVNLVDRLTAGAGPKPNIFIVVVDSLRRDYLSPYDSDIDFTPNIERFAGESVVMKNAFTHYGGTGLSEPSIWVGGMMVHKQYVTPFAPMNALQKLLEADGYHAFVTRDSILQTVVSPSPNLTELDQSIGGMNYDLCTSLDELGQKLASQPTNHPPLFAYTQPQNIHISVINREGAKPIDGANYRNFYAPYASRIRRLDGCFGKFVDTLKSRGLYDNSIVILTADHGDSLGEQGRWGHAYTIYPEIVRVPMIVHLPAALANLYSNPKGVAFSTDITPSLYYILGHKPIVNDAMFGRPLFTERPGEQAAYMKDTYLVASSYGAVYGILSGDGKSLFVSDAVNYKDYAFDLTSNDVGGSSVNSSTKTKYEKMIREGILAINRFYHYKGEE